MISFKTVDRPTPGLAAHLTVLIGLTWYAAFSLVSMPFSWQAARAFDRFVAEEAKDLNEFYGLSGLCYAVLAISELGLLVALIGGFVWLYQAWQRSEKRKRNPTVRPVVVLLWCLVPVWGYWRLQGFLFEIARSLRLSHEASGVGLWWWSFGAWIASYFLLRNVHHHGSLEIAGALIIAVSALLGIRMLRIFWRAERDFQSPID
jgi:hypothetical protein